MTSKSWITEDQRPQDLAPGEVRTSVRDSDFTAPAPPSSSGPLWSVRLVRELGRQRNYTEHRVVAPDESAAVDAVAELTATERDALSVDTVTRVDTSTSTSST